MTDNEIRIAIAEKCGWKLDDGGIHYRDPEGFYRPTGSMLNFKAGGLPDYPNDLNAMHEAEKTLNNEKVNLWYRYANELSFGVWRDSLPDAHLINATARQRAEAFCRTLGIWKDT